MAGQSQRRIGENQNRSERDGTFRAQKHSPTVVVSFAAVRVARLRSFARLFFSTTKRKNTACQSRAGTHAIPHDEHRACCSHPDEIVCAPALTRRFHLNLCFCPLCEGGLACLRLDAFSWTTVAAVVLASLAAKRPGQTVFTITPDVAQFLFEHLYILQNVPQLQMDFDSLVKTFERVFASSPVFAYDSAAETVRLVDDSAAAPPAPTCRDNLASVISIATTAQESCKNALTLFPERDSQQIVAARADAQILEQVNELQSIIDETSDLMQGMRT